MEMVLNQVKMVIVMIMNQDIVEILIKVREVEIFLIME